jgi:hypothetical protein
LNLHFVPFKLAKQGLTTQFGDFLTTEPHEILFAYLANFAIMAVPISLGTVHGDTGKGSVYTMAIENAKRLGVRQSSGALPCDQELSADKSSFLDADTGNSSVISRQLNNSQVEPGPRRYKPTAQMDCSAMRFLSGRLLASVADPMALDLRVDLRVKEWLKDAWTHIHYITEPVR